MKSMTADQNAIHEQFVRLFAANEPAIRAFVRRLLPTRDDAHEVMQEVAVMLWRKFDPDYGELDFRKWAFGVARYEVLAWRRDKARDRHLLSDDVLSLVADQSEEEEEGLSLQREALKDCLDKMAPRQRKLLLASYTAKGGVRQFARETGRTTQGLYQWRYRVRMMLLDCIRKSTGEAAP
jgi:RNA polymerase sigma-70 factor (ECF subfamily)